MPHLYYFNVHILLDFTLLIIQYIHKETVPHSDYSLFINSSLLIIFRSKRDTHSATARLRRATKRCTMFASSEQPRYH